MEENYVNEHDCSRNQTFAILFGAGTNGSVVVKDNQENVMGRGKVKIKLRTQSMRHGRLGL